jgi:glycosyltransferase involved in cell wall biosynthesis
MTGVGVVAIGRNEGPRLRACLTSALRDVRQVVYVDSGSSDDSVAMAKELGASAVELDLSTPFTAARARNAGFEKLAQIEPEIEFVQFVDGDCELAAGWIDRAVDELRAKPQAAVVCGRRRERFPDASIYNALCDIEWNTPVGEAKACGGDAMMRVSAFRDAGGYNDRVIAGEEPELCVRMRGRGWKIFRIDAEMTLHDAAITRFGQWWRRNVRAGHAYAEGFAMHGAPPERHWAKEVRSNWFWGAALPVVIVVLLIPGAFVRPLQWIAAALVQLYPLQFARLALRGPSGIAFGWAASIVVGKFAQALGQLKYHLSRRAGERSAIIEYKAPDRVAVAPPPPKAHPKAS